jgi:hypothetical protein
MLVRIRLPARSLRGRRRRAAGAAAICTAPSTTRAAAGSTAIGTAGAAIIGAARRAWGTDCVERLDLVGREDFFQLGLGFFFQGLDLGQLIVGEIEAFFHEAWQQMESGGWPAPAGTAGSALIAGTTPTRAAPTVLRRRTAAGILCHRPAGETRQTQAQSDREQKGN